ncbi:hypothetical protein MPSEU_000206100 [Mayamaea pseudoterrestris]|nr:hypothetical protein MPSEU_000206100 [Mayamaea pseudoterrestris]
MTSPSRKFRLMPGQHEVELNVSTHKSPLSPSNADRGADPDCAPSSSPTRQTTTQKCLMNTHSPNLEMHLNSQSNTENQILSSVAILLDNLKANFSPQHFKHSFDEETDTSNILDRKESSVGDDDGDDISSLASPAVSPRNRSPSQHTVSRIPQLNAQTLLDVAKFVTVLRYNEKTAPVGRELDELVKSMSDESMDRAPQVRLSEETLEALSLFIDHLSRNEASKRESMPPTQVYIPAVTTGRPGKSSEAIQRVNDNELANDHASKSQSIYKVPSVQTQDLDPDTISILGHYIDAVAAATPSSAVSHWGIGPPSLRLGESEIIFQSRSEDTEDGANAEYLSPSTAWQPIILVEKKESLKTNDDDKAGNDVPVFSFSSMEESAPPAPSPQPAFVNVSKTRVSSTRAPQEPGDASGHVAGMSEHRRNEQDSLDPALSNVRFTSPIGISYHSPPLNAPMALMSQTISPKEDPPSLSLEAEEMDVQSGEPEINLNRMYLRDDEFEINKLKKQPESPKKRSKRRDVATKILTCPDPTTPSVCGLKNDHCGELDNQEVNVGYDDDLSSASPSLVVSSEENISERYGVTRSVQNADAFVQGSSSVYFDCGKSRIKCEHENLAALSIRNVPADNPVESSDQQVSDCNAEDDAIIESSPQYNLTESVQVSPLHNHVSWEDEKKAEDTSKDILDSVRMTTLLSSLYKMLTDKAHPTSIDISRFRTLINIAYPYYESDRQPNAIERARIQVHARRKNVPIVLTNAFIESLQTLADSENILGIKPLLYSAVHSKCPPEEKMELILERLLLVKNTESRRDVAVYSLSGVGSHEGEAVEVDLHGHFGFARKDYGDADECVSDTEPWWEASARLMRQSKKHYASDKSTASRSLDPPTLESSSVESNDALKTTKKYASVDEDIIGFWQERERRLKKCSRATGASKWPQQRLSASYSATDNEISLRTKSSGSSSFSLLSAGTLESVEDEWIRKRSYAMWPNKYANKLQVWMGGKAQTDFEVDGPAPINAVNSVGILNRPSLLRYGRPKLPGTKQWKRTYYVRTHSHPGYFDVDVNSLYELSAVRGCLHRFDHMPWERRAVLQRFLYEQSISYNRNWFGTAHKIYGNDSILEPVCFPRSMEIPTKAEEWTEEWYTKPIPTLLSRSTADTKVAEEMAEIRRKYLVVDEFEEDPDSTQWEENPECGRIRNVKQKIGERVSRVTADLTSSLRRSRWRKKYFPKGTFPY